MFDRIAYTIPAHWLPALINADASGLEPDDASHLTLFTRSEVGGMHRQGWRFGHWSTDDSEPSFMSFHDGRPFGCLACECVTVVAHFYKP
jgi:hypothetical protein